MRNDKQHYQDGFFIYDISTFNERMVREAILNAVSHRMYQMSGSIFIRQHRDRLVVESPGDFPNGITVDNILNRQSPRNGLIIDKKMLSVIKKIGEERLESFSTFDFLIVNALYHENPVPESLRSRLKRLADIGVVEQYWKK